MKINNEKIQDVSVSKRKWTNVIDINFFKAYMKDLNETQLNVFIKSFMENKNVKPLYS